MSICVSKVHVWKRHPPQSLIILKQKWPLFPQTDSPVGFYLRKKVTGHAGGRAGPGWAGIWLCWARWAVLGRGIWPCWACGAGLGVGFGSGGRAGLGWARLLWVYFDLIDLLALFGVYAGIIFNDPWSNSPLNSLFSHRILVGSTGLVESDNFHVYT